MELIKCLNGSGKDIGDMDGYNTAQRKEEKQLIDLRGPKKAGVLVFDPGLTKERD